MPHKEPRPTPGIERPKKDNPVKCPNCSTVNYVTLNQLLRGFNCYSCGKQIDGVLPPAPDPDTLPIIEEEKMTESPE